MNHSGQGTIVGLVNASGSSGVSNRDEGWRLVFHFCAWRHPGSAVSRDELRCELAVDHEQLRTLMNQVKAYDIVKVESKDISDGKTATLLRILETNIDDSELARISRELQAPITISVLPFGRLTYDRGLHWYKGHATWSGRDIEVTLSCPADDTEEALRVARQLFLEQSNWDHRIADCVVEELLALKNEVWLQDGEDELSPQDFISRMTLRSINIDESGLFVFWYDDGDLFWGHSIEVVGDLSNGPMHADIAG
jgi:hypothetical protein